jgi:hypothetical protein
MRIGADCFTSKKNFRWPGRLVDESFFAPQVLYCSEIRALRDDEKGNKFTGHSTVKPLISGP